MNGKSAEYERYMEDQIPDYDAIAEARYEMEQSEIEDAKKLGITVEQLREKDKIDLQDDSWMETAYKAHIW